MGRRLPQVRLQQSHPPRASFLRCHLHASASAGTGRRCAQQLVCRALWFSHGRIAQYFLLTECGAMIWRAAEAAGPVGSCYYDVTLFAGTICDMTRSTRSLLPPVQAHPSAWRQGGHSERCRRPPAQPSPWTARDAAPGSSRRAPAWAAARRHLPRSGWRLRSSCCSLRPRWKVEHCLPAAWHDKTLTAAVNSPSHARQHCHLCIKGRQFLD